MMLIIAGFWNRPAALEGRIPAFLIGLYAFAVFGYIYEIPARYFVGRGICYGRSELQQAKSIYDKRDDLEALQYQIRRYMKLHMDFNHWKANAFEAHHPSSFKGV